MKGRSTLWSMLAGGVALFMAAPLLWLAVTSVRTAGDIAAHPLRPRGVTVDNYAAFLTRPELLRWTLNSLALAGGQTVVSLLLASLAGYAVARHRLPGLRAMAVVVAGVAVLPGALLLPGAYQLIVSLGWLDRYAAVAVPGLAALTAVVLYAQAMRQIPGELLDAARLDGAGEWTAYLRVAMPAVRPTTAALVLLQFLAAWNSVVWPTLVLHDPSRQTLATGLAALSALPMYQANPGLLAAGTVVSLLPVAAVFAMVQRELRI